MKTCLSVLAAVALGLGCPPARGADLGKKDEKSPLPGKATWDLQPLRNVFRIVRTDYDERKKEVTWTVQTRQGYRTSDFVREIDQARPFTFTFYDAEMNEVGVVRLTKADFQGIPSARVMKEGTQLRVTLAVPRTIGKARKVALTRGRRD